MRKLGLSENLDQSLKISYTYLQKNDKTEKLVCQEVL